MITWRVCTQRRWRSGACPCFNHVFHGNNISCSKKSVYFVVENTFNYVTSCVTLAPWLCVFIFVNQILDLLLAFFGCLFGAKAHFNLIADFKLNFPCILAFLMVMFFSPEINQKTLLLVCPLFIASLSFPFSFSAASSRLGLWLCLWLCLFNDFCFYFVEWKLKCLKNCSILQKSPCNMWMAVPVIVKGTIQHLTEFGFSEE